MRPRFLDDAEKIAPFTSPGGKHVVVFDVMVGGPKLRLEFGEGCLAIAKKGGTLRLLGPKPGPELTDRGWEDFVTRTSSELNLLDRQSRLLADKQGEYWQTRPRFGRRGTHLGHWQCEYRPIDSRTNRASSSGFG